MLCTPPGIACYKQDLPERSGFGSRTFLMRSAVPTIVSPRPLRALSTPQRTSLGSDFGWVASRIEMLQDTQFVEEQALIRVQIASPHPDGAH